jgi:hypothetical protein
MLPARAGIALLSTALVLAFIRPEPLLRSIDEVLAASWRALGDHLARRKLEVIAQRVDRDRQAAEVVAALRNDISAHLSSVERDRKQIAADAKLDCLLPGLDTKRALARLDATIAMFRSALARADRVLDRAASDLRDRENELILLRAAVVADQIDRELTEAEDELSAWNGCVACGRVFGGASVWDDNEPNGGNARSRLDD